jgi:filamentous hemagglutinin
MVRDALYDGRETVNYVQNDDGSLTKVTSYDNSLYNAATASVSTLAAGAFGAAAGVNDAGSISAAQNEVFNNSLSSKYSTVTAQVSACGGQRRECYVEALKTTQAAYKQAQQDVASACGSGRDAAACNTAKSDAAQLYINQKAFARSVATMTDYNTPLSNALHTAALDGLSLVVGSAAGKLVLALRSGWNSLSGSVTSAFDNAVELTTVGDEPYSWPDRTSDGGMAHPVGSNNAASNDTVATNTAGTSEGTANAATLQVEGPTCK